MPIFREVRTLKSVQVVYEIPALNVQWANQILKDDEVLNEALERKAYTVDNVLDFVNEVDGARLYLPIVGWEGLVPPLEE